MQIWRVFQSWDIQITATKIRPPCFFLNQKIFLWSCGATHAQHHWWAGIFSLPLHFLPPSDFEKTNCLKIVISLTSQPPTFSSPPPTFFQPPPHFFPAPPLFPAPSLFSCPHFLLGGVVLVTRCPLSQPLLATLCNMILPIILENYCVNSSFAPKIELAVDISSQQKRCINSHKSIISADLCLVYLSVGTS